jgi:homoserine kinase
MNGSVRVRVPATSANLGPGFDEAHIGEPGLTIEVAGEGEATAAAGESHLVVRAMRVAFGLLDGQPPGLTLRCVNRIPQGRGLGSSAAAVVSGVLAARALTDGGDERMPLDAVLRLASDLEGHPDNVAACLFGGLTIAWTGGGGARAIRLAPRHAIVPLVLVAPKPLATETARGVLPDSVPHADAAANAARAALLVAALTSTPENLPAASHPAGIAGSTDAGATGSADSTLTGTEEALLEGTRDWLHQPYRAGVMPATAELVRRLRAAGVPAVVSGAGPSVLAFLVRPNASGLAAGPGMDGLDIVDSTTRDMGIGWDISVLDVDRRGATIQSVTPGSVPPGGTP